MFKNFAASIAPKSFNLERYLAKSKQVTKISSRIANAIKQKLQDEYSYSTRTGILVSATACNGTIVTIDDDILAEALYVAINSDDFNEKLNIAYEHMKFFSDIKFFVNKKTKKVCFVYYNCQLDRSKEFLSVAYDNLLELVSLFSTSEYTIHVNYKYLFTKFLYDSTKTSFLTSFFISICEDEYPFSSNEMDFILRCLLACDRLSPDISTKIPGMYINSVDHFFRDSKWPRNIQINILRYIHNKNAFTSYDDFFRNYDTDKALQTFDRYGSFVYDDDAVKNALTFHSDTDEFTTWTVTKSWDIHTHIVIKIKDLEHADKYINTIKACVERLNKFVIVLNATKDSIYLFLTPITSISLDTVVTSPDVFKCSYLTSIMQRLAKEVWNFSFKPNAPILKCLLNSSPYICLNPLYIHMLDFDNTGEHLDYKLIVLNIIQEYVKSKKTNVNSIYMYSFMKILPPNFAQNVISYLENGTLIDENTDNWGDVLTFNDLAKIRFLDNLSRINPDRVTFLPSAYSDENVQKIIAKKSLEFQNDYINSPECLQYISDIGLELTDDTLAKIFTSEDTEKFCLQPVKVIVSKASSVSNSYQIVGVVWNECGLTPIGKLFQDGKVDAPVFYKLLSSLLYNKRKHHWGIDKNNICQMLADADYNVFLNYNALTLSDCNERYTVEGHFKSLFEALDAHRDMRIPFEYFSYNELYDNGKQYTANNVLLCKEHNLYYIEGSLCPECRKIYCIVSRPSSNHVYDNVSWYFCKSNLKNSLIASTTGATLNPSIIKQCKLGIVNGLFEKFFFKPDSLAICDDKVIGALYFDMGKFDFNNLLPISVFESKQRLQVVQVMYKKLLPLILDGSCICDKREFFESIAMHKDYKGELIILKLPLMQCDAILAKDAVAIETTKLVFADFLIKYIESDPCLCAAIKVKGSALYDLIQDVDNLKFSKEALEECISAFCDVHNIPFSSKNKLCPLCLADGITPEDIILLPENHFKQLQQGKPAFEGGEATLYIYSSEQIQKLFKPGVDLQFKSKIIGKALLKKYQFMSFNKDHTDIKFITIDKVLYESSGNSIKLKGFVQEQIEDAFKISCLKDKEFVSSQGYTRYDITEILIKVCIGIEFLHSIGGYIGDLNGGNILIKGKNVYFIDMDGMSFDDVRNFVYTDMYIYPPSAERKNITKDDDWYSLAIQAFYYFTYSHPFRGISTSESLPADEITRMKQGKSVLGKHGIKVPNISIGWDFMPKELILFFKNTFEGKRRESMRNILELFKATLDAPEADTEMKFIEVKRSSPCRFALSYNTYIDTSGYLLWCESKLVKFTSGTISCKIAGDYIILTTPGGVTVLNDTTGQFKIYSAISKDDKVYASNGELYYISCSENNVHLKHISSKSHQETDRIVVDSSTLVPFDFLVTEERKFIFLVKNKTYVSIYCNLEEFTSVDVSKLGNNIESHLFYDNASENYLVLLSGNHQTIGILILSDGSYSQIIFNDEISSSSCFYKNTLYYMIGDTIYFYNVIDGTGKEFTSQFAASGCLIERKANRFVICSKEKTYMYIKS